MKIRCSQLGRIMSNPTKREMDNGEVLSKGAKTYLTQVAKEYFFGYRSEIDSKYIDKGINCESNAIKLYNDVNFTSHKKNEERKENDFLTGECDIITEDSIIDIKTSWSLETFPATKNEALSKSNASLYEYQGRGYMMLYQKESFDLVYSMVTTPNEILKEWDNHQIHLVDHIAPEHRLTVLRYERDIDIEYHILMKCEKAIEFMKQVINEIKNK